MTRGMGTLALLAPLATALLVTAAMAQTAPIAIAPGDTITGNLDGKDPAFEDGSHYECYAITGAAGSSVLVTMRSATFDTYLVAVSTTVGTCQEVPADVTAVTDDDGGGGANGTDSQLTLTFDANGRFLIAANSFAPNTLGQYTITAEAVAGGGGGAGVGKVPAAAPEAPPTPAK